MADIVTQHNIGAMVTERIASAPLAWTAAGAGDNTTKTGIDIDREALANGGSLPDSALFAVLFGATLASGATLSISFDVREGPDGTNYSDYASQSSIVVATGPSGGGVVNGQTVFAVNLSSARRHVRCDFVPDLSAAGTDTAIAVEAATLGGFDRLPSPA